MSSKLRRPKMQDGGRGQWCGSVGREVAPDTRGLRSYILIPIVNCIEKTKINKKSHFRKKGHFRKMQDCVGSSVAATTGFNRTMSA